MKTEVFESYAAFLAREDKTVNGVLPGYPTQDSENIGCWMCFNCTGCSGCSDCSYCMGCMDCSGCRYIPTGAKYACMTGLYKYTCSPRIHADGTQWVQMGCHLRTREDWERDEWNNPNEFPNDGSHESQRRHSALMTAFAWLDANAKKEEGK